MAEVLAGEQIDLVRSRRASLLIGGLPALVMLLAAMAPLSDPSPHWLWIGVGTLFGAVARTILPERIWGTYVGGRDPGAGAGGC